MQKTKKAIVVDLDGTLFKDIYKKFMPDVISEKTWSKFHENVNYYKDNELNEDIAKICKTFLDSGFKVFFLTAREGNNFIKDNTAMALYDVFPEYKHKYELVMRDIGCEERAPKMKLTKMQEYIMKNHEVTLAIDDCISNIEMFQSLNIPTLHYREMDN